MSKKHFYATVILLSFLATGIPPVLAGINIPGDGSGEGIYYDSLGNTYTLKVDVHGTITITLDEITLDGGGTIIKPSLAESTTGIYVLDKSGVTIQNVTIQENDTGEGFSYGIQIQDSDNITLTSNTVSGCNDSISELGINIENSFNNLLSDNNVSNNGTGIKLYLGLSDDNTLNNNIISNNYYGVYLYGTGSSSNNTLTGNQISGNKGGIYLVNSNDNTINNNKFIGNIELIFCNPFLRKFPLRICDQFQGYFFIIHIINKPLSSQQC